uniref:Salt-induced S2 n=1 Tax=Halogeton glomeratus TaxID=454499 RepID=A0A1P8LI12_9CARY|nr:salt-induced S2 [Halogeton glomeratus]
MAQFQLPKATLFFLVFLFMSKAWATTTTGGGDDDNAVLDWEGNPVQTNYPYFIVPLKGLMTGLIYYPRVTKRCHILNAALSPHLVQ